MGKTVSLHLWDWIAIGGFLTTIVIVALYFTKRAGKDIQSFFIASRTLPWYIAGISIIATNFASDTPLWITNLIRKYGIPAVWQYWAMSIGAALAIVLFARLWRRVGLVTDIEFIELRYSGTSAAVLRFWLAFSFALFVCPLSLAWVTKAMETISSEVLGLSPEYQAWTITAIITIAVITCTFSGLYGVVYTAFLQFIVAWGGTFILAILAVQEIGGLSVLVDKLTNMQEWKGNTLKIVPHIGFSAEGRMSLWNIIGYFGIMWFVGTLASGGKEVQRLLSCRDSKHATYAQMLNTVVYWGILAWPWIIVALCSLILFPDLGAGITDDAVAYPRMIVTILPTFLRGLLISALLAAFISTVNTLYNWGSSYLINDIYKRFLAPDASNRHSVWAGRVSTILLAILGGYISFRAESIQQLLEISYLVLPGLALTHILRWFWPRMNATGEIFASLVAYALAALLISGSLNGLAREIFGFPAGVAFHKDYDYLGARIFVMIVVITLAAIIGSLLTKKTDEKILANFVKRAKPIKIFWKKIIMAHDINYHIPESIPRIFLSWILVLITVFSLIFGIGKFLLGSPLFGLTYTILFILTLWLTLRRVNRDFREQI